MCERNIDWMPFACPQLGTWPATQACAQTRNRTINLLVHKLMLNPLSHISQGKFYLNVLHLRGPHQYTPDRHPELLYFLTHHIQSITNKLCFFCILNIYEGFFYKLFYFRISTTLDYCSIMTLILSFTSHSPEQIHLSKIQIWLSHTRRGKVGSQLWVHKRVYSCNITY